MLDQETLREIRRVVKEIVDERLGPVVDTLAGPQDRLTGQRANGMNDRLDRIEQRMDNLHVKVPPWVWVVLAGIVALAEAIGSLVK